MNSAMKDGRVVGIARNRIIARTDQTTCWADQSSKNRIYPKNIAQSTAKSQLRK